MHIEWFKDRIDDLEKAYYTEPVGVPITGITIAHLTDEDVEKYAISFLDKKELNEYVYAWKAGTLVKENGKYKPREKNGKYINGYGLEIDKKELRDYMERVSKRVDIGDEFKPMYECLYKLAPPKYFGAVYMINLLFFKSGGRWPIYDRFAHKATKALFMEKCPDQVYVGEAPAKKNINDVVNMYSEYVWLLEKLFGYKEIDRRIDRALWVYGHATDNFSITV